MEIAISPGDLSPSLRPIGACSRASQVYQYIEILRVYRQDAIEGGLGLIVALHPREVCAAEDGDLACHRLKDL